MSYAVHWLEKAERALTKVWSDAPDRRRIAAAADQIDSALARDPLSLGESRSDATRIAIVAPLAVLFDVDANRRIVTVWSLWRWREHT
jgi:hypothetical protein